MASRVACDGPAGEVALIQAPGVAFSEFNLTFLGGAARIRFFRIESSAAMRQKDGLLFAGTERRFVALARGIIHGRHFDYCERENAIRGSDAGYAASLGTARYTGTYWNEIWLRNGAVR